MRKLVIIVFLMILLCSTIALAANKKKIKPNLVITSSPKKIDIYLNNQRYQTPLKLNFKPGKVTVWGLATGYEVFKKQVTIPKTGTLKLFIKLHHFKQKEPPEGAP